MVRRVVRTYVYDDRTHGRPQEFLQERQSLPPPFPLHSFLCLSILLLPYLPFSPVRSILTFLLCCEANPFNTARGFVTAR